MYRVKHSRQVKDSQESFQLPPYYRREDLKGRAIFITGCDSGFGFSLALHCADLGMEVCDCVCVCVFSVGHS